MVKKNIAAILAIAVFCVCFPRSGISAPCYGTIMPEKNKIFAGFGFYSLFDRNLEAHYGSVRSNQYFFQVSYGLLDWLSLDLKIGFGSLKQHPLDSDEIDYKTNFAGGYGFRIQLFENDRTKMKAVFGFQHISTHPGSARIANLQNRAILDDWQFSLLFSKEVGRLMPYAGIKWSRVDYIHWIEEDRERRMSDLTQSIGIVSGIDIPLTEKSWLNIEGHFLDEEAIAVAIMFAF